MVFLLTDSIHTNIVTIPRRTLATNAVREIDYRSQGDSHTRPMKRCSREQGFVAAVANTVSCAAGAKGLLLFRAHTTRSSEGTPSGTIVPFRSRHRASLTGVHARRDDDGPASGAGPSSRSLLKPDELSAIEKTFEGGITAVQIVDAFTSRGIKFSEASFRKYVQQGLLPRSRRVGRKGKHRGSLGVYPSKTVRRINTVKGLMADGYTIEEIQGQFLLYTDLVEGVAENLTELCTKLGADLDDFDPAEKKEIERELADTRRDGDRVVARLETLARRVAAPRTDNLRLAGAAGDAEDLL